MQVRIGHHIEDDAGVRVPLWLPRLGADRCDTVPAEVRQRLEFLLDRGDSDRRFRIVMAMLAGVVLAPMGMTLTTIWPLVAAAATIAVLLFILHRRMMWGTLAREVRQTLIASGCCASCGYTLRGLPAAADELTMCPECSARWRLPPGSADAEAPGAPLGVGDHPKWKRGRLGRLLEGAGMGFLLIRGSYSTQDDLGRAVEIIFPWVRQRPPTCWPELAQHRQRQIEARLYSLGRARRFVLASIFFLVLVLVVRIMTRGGPGGPPLTLAIVLPMTYALLIVSVFAYPRIRNRRRIVDLVLSYDLCASCAADLSETARDSQGLIECPRCRAAWNPRPDASLARQHAERNPMHDMTAPSTPPTSPLHDLA
jgi:Zn-finger nucleic acid-binding protein